MRKEVLETTRQSTTLKPALGFAGLGWIGRNRMEAIVKSGCADVSCIAEPSEENAQAALKSVPAAFLFKDIDELIHDQEIDGIVIATPSALHAGQAIKALKNNKAVFCQKPLGRTEGEVREVVKLAAEINKPLGVDLSYRYTDAAVALRKAIINGEIGKIFAVDLIFHNAYGPDKPWFYDIKQSGGGCVIDLGTHLVDMALWCLGFPQIKKVDSALYHKGKRLTDHEEQVEDFASASLTTGSDTIINLQCSWNLPAGQDAVIEARFYGTEGGGCFRNVNGSFYDFVAEKYHGASTENLVSPPDNWSGRAGVIWVEKLAQHAPFDAEEGEELIRVANVIDRIYGR